MSTPLPEDECPALANRLGSVPLELVEGGGYELLDDCDSGGIRL